MLCKKNTAFYNSHVKYELKIRPQLLLNNATNRGEDANSELLYNTGFYSAVIRTQFQSVITKN